MLCPTPSDPLFAIDLLFERVIGITSTYASIVAVSVLTGLALSEIVYFIDSFPNMEAFSKT